MKKNLPFLNLLSQKTDINEKSSDVNQPLYGYLQAFFRAFFDGRLYVDVAKRWRGFGVIYLFLLTAILVLPMSIYMMINVNSFIKYELLEPIMTLPQISIQNGRIISSAFLPKVVKNQRGQVTSVVDPESDMAVLEQQYPEASILITAKAMTIRTADVQPVLERSLGGLLSYLPESLQNPPINAKLFSSVKHYSFDENMQEHFDGKNWLTPMRVLGILMLIDAMIYSVLFFLFFLLWVSIIAICSLMAQLVAQYVLKTTLTYKVVCRLLTVSVTAVLTFIISMISAHFLFKTAGLFMWVIWGSYFCFGVLAVKRDSRALVF